MAYGLRVKDAVGNIVLDTTDRITRFRYSNEVSAGASGNTTLSDISGLLSVEFSMKLSDVDIVKVPHSVSRSDTTISWVPNSGVSGYYESSASIIFLFLYT